MLEVLKMFSRISANNALLRNGLLHRTGDTATVVVWYHYSDWSGDDTNCFCVHYSLGAYVASCLYDPSMDEVASIPTAESALIDFVSCPSKLSTFALCVRFVVDEVILLDACANIQYSLRRDELACY